MRLVCVTDNAVDVCIADDFDLKLILCLCAPLLYHSVLVRPGEVGIATLLNSYCLLAGSHHGNIFHLWED